MFDHIVKRKQFSEDDARIVMRHVVDAVHYCHMNNIIHRDLKPQNILLGEYFFSIPRLFHSSKDLNSILLSDFGFASRFTDGRQYMTTSLGTPGYTAPEVLKNQKYSKKVDIWSLGVITYIMYAMLLVGLFLVCVAILLSLPTTMFVAFNASVRDTILLIVPIGMISAKMQRISSLIAYVSMSMNDMIHNKYIQSTSPSSIDVGSPLAQYLYP